VAACVTVAALLLAAITVDGANAATSSPTGGSGVVWSQPLLPTNSVANSIAYLRAQYGVSQTEAQRRLRLQQLAPSIDAQLTKSFSNVYAGMWFDQVAGGILQIDSTSPAAIVSVVKASPDAAHIRVQAVPYSLTQLNATRATLDAQINANGYIADVITDPAHDDVVVYQRVGATAAGANARTSAALSSAEKAVTATNARVNALVAAVHGQAVVRQQVVGAAKSGLTTAVAATAGCPVACPPPLRAGARLDVKRTVAANDSDDLNQLWGECTNGFNVTSASGGHYLLTAAHCMVGSDKTGINSTYDNARRLISTEVVDFENGSATGASTYPVDYSIQPISNVAYWQGTSAKNQLADYCWLGMSTLSKCATQNIAVAGYVAYANVIVGTVLCATGTGDNDANNGYKSSGAAPGTRCGEVTSLNGGVVTNICSRKGDSGGPLFSEVTHLAYGILNSGTVGSGPCPTSKPGSEWSQYSPVDKILANVNAQTLAKEHKSYGFALQTKP
jgi:streptogrisin C